MTIELHKNYNQMVINKHGLSSFETYMFKDKVYFLHFLGSQTFDLVSFKLCIKLNGSLLTIHTSFQRCFFGMYVNFLQLSNNTHT